jgi:hypothetical protein
MLKPFGSSYLGGLSRPAKLPGDPTIFGHLTITVKPGCQFLSAHFRDL